MKTVSQARQMEAGFSNTAGFAVETTFVLFFLAIEFGQSFQNFGLENIMMAITLLMVAVMPYFLPSEEKPDFADWIIGRSLIAAFGIGLGWMFKQSIGIVLPEMFRFLPMTLLIIAAMISCYIQFYGFLKIRVAK